MPVALREPRGEDVEVSVVRGLTPDDLAVMALQAPAPLPAGTLPAQGLRIRHSHHQLARLLAAGASNVEAGLITGYDSGYISRLQAMPEFQELLQTYGANEDLRWADVKERLMTLGLSAWDELQHRLESNPDQFTRRDLMDLTELGLIKPIKAAAGAAPGGAGSPRIAVNVSFVQAQPQELKQIDQEPQR